MNWKDRCANPLCAKPSEFQFENFSPPAIALMRCQHCRTVFKLVVERDHVPQFMLFDPSKEPPEDVCER